MPAGRTKKVTPADVARFVRLYKSGLTLHEIARNERFGHVTIHRYLKTAGVKMQRPGHRRKEALTNRNLEIIATYKTCGSGVVAATILNISPQRVFQVLAKARNLGTPS